RADMELNRRGKRHRVQARLWFRRRRVVICCTRRKEQAMEQEKLKIPVEAVDLYTRYIHGEISRRDFFDMVSRFAVTGLSAAAIVERLMPNYVLGQQVRKDD